jgi:hypothetical protein
VAKQGGDFALAVRAIVEAMLQSPRFIYRIERPRGEGAPNRLSGYELAARLSYILWGGPPDQELMRAAEAGELADAGRVEAQVRRMLEDPRSVEWSTRFIHEWMHLDRLSHLRPNRKRFPRWDERLAGDMRAETLAFFKHVVWEQKRPVWELLNVEVTFVTPRLAEHYGLLRDQIAAEASKHEASPPRRVADGLLALYTFEEKAGNTVGDVSGSKEPIQLKIADNAGIRWTDQGLEVRASTLIASAAPPKRIRDAITKSKAMTIEAWVTPANTSQAGPARIVTLSADTGSRNFTLGQDGDKYEMRFRTSKSDSNGLPGVVSASGSVDARLTHVVYTRSAEGKAKLYVNGEEKAARDDGGDLSTWDGRFRLAMANELTGDRPWQGTLHLVAIYERAISADEVQINRAAGARPGQPTAPAVAYTGSRRKDLQALYLFDEGKGETVHDTSNAGEPVNLKIENASSVEWEPGGLAVKEPTLITSGDPPKRLIEAIKKSKAVTLEAWVAPADNKQAGPARMVTLSCDTSSRNFTLGQDGDKFVVRFRTTKLDANGLPSLAAPSGTVMPKLTHVAYTRDAAGQARLYIGGEEKAAREVAGDLASWDEGFRLGLANESTRDRPWRGTYRLVAIYSRALSPDEIRSHTKRQPREQTIARYDLTSVPERGGLLTQGSVLTMGGEEASMVTRGLFVLRELLYSGVEDPPPCVDTTPVPTKPGMSQRAIAEQRIGNKSCAGCHSKFEPLAFGLEKLDGLGAFHETDEHGNKLLDDGEILFPGEEKPVAYKTSAELMNLLAGSERVRKGITRKVTQFAIGRPLVAADEPIVDKIHEGAKNGGGTYASLITAIVMSDLVQVRGANEN